MTPINNTPDIAKIVTGSKRVTAMNGDLEAADVSVTKYTYNPSECLNWQYGMISSMKTTEGICDENGQDPWNGGTYIRCQIMTLNKYGNTAINGWDGSSINLDKEKGVILAPTIGAGYKDKATNLFTGVVDALEGPNTVCCLVITQFCVHQSSSQQIFYLRGKVSSSLTSPESAFLRVSFICLS